MFESQIELEKQQGIRGPFTRYFAVIDSEVGARLALRDVALLTLVLAGFWGLLAIRGSGATLVFAIPLALAGVLLLLTPSRLGAGCLVVFGGTLLVLAGINLPSVGPFGLVALATTAPVLPLGLRAYTAVRVLRPSAPWAAPAASPTEDTTRSASPSDTGNA
jgi:hypothetical protein